MQNIRRSDIMAIHLIAGALTGLVVLLFAYALLMNASQTTFTFPLLAEMHRNMPALYLLDLFPAYTIVTSYFLGRTQARRQVKYDRSREQSIENNKRVASVIRNLAAGTMDVDLTAEHVDEEIVSSLRSLQQKMNEDNEAAKVAKAADEKQGLTAEGLAAFGDLLRGHAGDEEKLGYAVVSQLVHHLKINQGGFFVTRKNNDERHLEMIACYAYDRKKFPDRKLAWGEGLIGAAAIEKQSFYTDRIPEHYLSITSGLGRATPRYLLIVPMFLNEEVYGVLELASFHDFPDYQIRFVERVAENTATTLNNMYNNLRTEALLRETQEQASKLAIQEEQVRKNIEELRSTQLEAARQSEQFISFTDTVNHTLIRAEYASDGTLIYANTRFLRQLGYSGNREVEGKHIESFIHASDRPWFKGMWKNLSEGGPHFEGYMRHFTKLGQELWTMATYTCVRKDDGSIDKILFLALDATSQKEESLNYESKVNALNQLLPQAEFGTDGKILFANSLFQETLFGSNDKIQQSSIFESVPLSEHERFNGMWEQIVAGEPLSGQVRMIDSNREERWFMVNFTPVVDTYGEVHRIVFLGIDNSREKELEASLRDQNEHIREVEQLMKLQTLDMENQVREIQRQRTDERKEMQKEVARFAGILELGPTPVVSINNMGFVVLFNHASEKYFKIKKNKVLNQPGERLFGQEQTDPIIQAFYQPGKHVIEAEQTEVTMLLPDHQRQKVSVSVFETKSGKELIFTLFIYK